MALRCRCIPYSHSMIDTEWFACRFAVEKPLRRQLDSWIPSTNTCSYLLSNGGFVGLYLRGRLTFDCSFTSAIRDDIFPYITTGRRCSRCRGERIRAIRSVILDPLVHQLKVVPDIARLIVSAVRFLWQDGDICPSRSASRISPLLKLHDALVEEVVVPRTYVDEDSISECRTEVA